MDIIITLDNIDKYFDILYNARIDKAKAKAPYEDIEKEVKPPVDRFTGKKTFSYNGRTFKYSDRESGYDMAAIKRAYPDIDFEPFRKPPTKVLTLEKEVIIP